MVCIYPTAYGLSIGLPHSILPSTRPGLDPPPVDYSYKNHQTYPHTMISPLDLLLPPHGLGVHLVFHPCCGVGYPCCLRHPCKYSSQLLFYCRPGHLVATLGWLLATPSFVLVRLRSLWDTSFDSISVIAAPVDNLEVMDSIRSPSKPSPLPRRVTWV